jgi:hypothetical protein
MERRRAYLSVLHTWVMADTKGREQKLTLRMYCSRKLDASKLSARVLRIYLHN